MAVLMLSVEVVVVLAGLGVGTVAAVVAGKVFEAVDAVTGNPVTMGAIVVQLNTAGVMHHSHAHGSVEFEPGHLAGRHLPVQHQYRFEAGAAALTMPLRKRLTGYGLP
jgi:hypothetical protein